MAIYRNSTLNYNGNEEGASGQSPCKLPSDNEELVSHSRERLQGDVAGMSNTIMCDTLAKGQDPRIHAFLLSGRLTQAKAPSMCLLSNKSLAVHIVT